MSGNCLGDLLGVLSYEKHLGIKRQKEENNDEKDMTQKDMKSRKSHTCVKCHKCFTYLRNLSRHKLYYCKNDSGRKVPILKLKWDGKVWKTMRSCSTIMLYHIKLGRELDNLIKKHAINEDVLNSVQKDYLTMYRKLFDDSSEIMTS